MTKEQFKEIIKNTGSIGTGDIIFHPGADISREPGTFIQYEMQYKNKNTDWNKIKLRIDMTIKALSEALNTKVTLWYCDIFNAVHKVYVLIRVNLDYKHLPER